MGADHGAAGDVGDVPEDRCSAAERNDLWLHLEVAGGVGACIEDGYGRDTGGNAGRAVVGCGAGDDIGCSAGRVGIGDSVARAGVERGAGTGGVLI